MFCFRDGGQCLERLACRIASPTAISRRQWLGMAGLGWQFLRDGSRRRLVPSKEARRDPELSRLIAEIHGMVVRRAAEALVSLMDRVFRVEFDAGQGPLAFQKFWKPEDPRSELWEVMPRLLAMGGTFYSPTLFAIPYVYTQFPIDLNPLGHVVALGHSVAVRAKPDTQASPLCSLDFDIVPTVEELSPPVLLHRSRWVGVVTPNGLGVMLRPRRFVLRRGTGCSSRTGKDNGNGSV